MTLRELLENTANDVEMFCHLDNNTIIQTKNISFVFCGITSKLKEFETPYFKDDDLDGLLLDIQTKTEILSYLDPENESYISTRCIRYQCCCLMNTITELLENMKDNNND